MMQSAQILLQGLAVPLTTRDAVEVGNQTNLTAVSSLESQLLTSRKAQHQPLYDSPSQTNLQDVATHNGISLADQMLAHKEDNLVSQHFKQAAKRVRGGSGKGMSSKDKKKIDREKNILPRAALRLFKHSPRLEKVSRKVKQAACSPATRTTKHEESRGFANFGLAANSANPQCFEKRKRHDIRATVMTLSLLRNKHQRGKPHSLQNSSKIASTQKYYSLTRPSKDKSARVPKETRYEDGIVPLGGIVSSSQRHSFERGRQRRGDQKWFSLSGDSIEVHVPCSRSYDGLLNERGDEDEDATDIPQVQIVDDFVKEEKTHGLASAHDLIGGQQEKTQQQFKRLQTVQSIIEHQGEAEDETSLPTSVEKPLQPIQQKADHTTLLGALKMATVGFKKADMEASMRSTMNLNGNLNLTGTTPDTLVRPCESQRTSSAVPPQAELGEGGKSRTGTEIKKNEGNRSSGRLMYIVSMPSAQKERASSQKQSQGKLNQTCTNMDIEQVLKSPSSGKRLIKYSFKKTLAQSKLEPRAPIKQIEVQHSPHIYHNYALLSPLLPAKSFRKSPSEKKAIETIHENSRSKSFAIRQDKSGLLLDDLAAVKTVDKSTIDGPLADVLQVSKVQDRIPLPAQSRPSIAVKKTKKNGRLNPREQANNQMVTAIQTQALLTYKLIQTQKAKKKDRQTRQSDESLHGNKLYFGTKQARFSSEVVGLGRPVTQATLSPSSKLITSTQTQTAKVHPGGDLQSQAAGKGKAISIEITQKRPTQQPRFATQVHYRNGLKQESFSQRGFGVGFASQASRFGMGPDLQMASVQDKLRLMNSLTTEQIAPQGADQILIGEVKPLGSMTYADSRALNASVSVNQDLGQVYRGAKSFQHRHRLLSPQTRPSESLISTKKSNIIQRGRPNEQRKSMIGLFNKASAAVKIKKNQFKSATSLPVNDHPRTVHLATEVSHDNREMDVVSPLLSEARRQHPLSATRERLVSSVDRIDKSLRSLTRQRTQEALAPAEVLSVGADRNSITSGIDLRSSSQHQSVSRLLARSQSQGQVWEKIRLTAALKKEICSPQVHEDTFILEEQVSGKKGNVYRLADQDLSHRAKRDHFVSGVMDTKVQYNQKRKANLPITVKREKFRVVDEASEFETVVERKRAYSKARTAQPGTAIKVSKAFKKEPSQAQLEKGDTQRAILGARRLVASCKDRGKCKVGSQAQASKVGSSTELMLEVDDVVSIEFKSPPTHHLPAAVQDQEQDQVIAFTTEQSGAEIEIADKQQRVLELEKFVSPGPGQYSSTLNTMAHKNLRRVNSAAVKRGTRQSRNQEALAAATSATFTKEPLQAVCSGSLKQELSRVRTQEDLNKILRCKLEQFDQPIKTTRRGPDLKAQLLLTCTSLKRIKSLQTLIPHNSEGKDNSAAQPAGAGTQGRRATLDLAKQTITADSLSRNNAMVASATWSSKQPFVGAAATEAQTTMRHTVQGNVAFNTTITKAQGSGGGQAFFSPNKTMTMATTQGTISSPSLAVGGVALANDVKRLKLTKTRSKRKSNFLEMHGRTLQHFSSTKNGLDDSATTAIKEQGTNTRDASPPARAANFCKPNPLISEALFALKHTQQDPQAVIKTIKKGGSRHSLKVANPLLKPSSVHNKFVPAGTQRLPSAQVKAPHKGLILTPQTATVLPSKPSRFLQKTQSKRRLGGHHHKDSLVQLQMYTEWHQRTLLKEKSNTTTLLPSSLLISPPDRAYLPQPSVNYIEGESIGQPIDLNIQPVQLARQSDHGKSKSILDHSYDLGGASSGRDAPQGIYDSLDPAGSIHTIEQVKEQRTGGATVCMLDSQFSTVSRLDAELAAPHSRQQLAYDKKQHFQLPRVQSVVIVPNVSLKSEPVQALLKQSKQLCQTRQASANQRMNAGGSHSSRLPKPKTDITIIDDFRVREESGKKMNVLEAPESIQRLPRGQKLIGSSSLGPSTQRRMTRRTSRAATDK